MHQSIHALPSLAQPPPPPPHPGLLRGICPPFQSQGWGICKFCAARGRALAPRGYSRDFDTHAVSYQNITTQRTLLKKKADLLICQGQRVLKACSRFYACISSFLIKPELHSKTREVSTWINVFGLVNGQISLDIIWRTSFHIYNLFITYRFTALY